MSNMAARLAALEATFGAPRIPEADDALPHAELPYRDERLWRKIDCRRRLAMLHFARREAVFTRNGSQPEWDAIERRALAAFEGLAYPSEPWTHVGYARNDLSAVRNHARWYGWDAPEFIIEAEERIIEAGQLAWEQSGSPTDTLEVAFWVAAYRSLDGRPSRAESVHAWTTEAGFVLWVHPSDLDVYERDVLDSMGRV
ncbi:MAG: hypothetical protein WD557_05780 [Dehalococcoidia bacterium]